MHTSPVGGSRGRARGVPGDPANSVGAASENRSTECFVVNPVTPALTTQAGGGGVLGSGVSDSATLTGTATEPMTPVIRTTEPPVAPAAGAPAAAGGTIVFKLYGPDDCSTLAYTSAAVGVTGDGSYATPAAQFKPSSIGTYHWVATYTPSSVNNSATTHNTGCDDTDEDVTVTDVASTMTTAQSWVPNDTATISAAAGGNLSGTAHFTLYASANCADGTAVDSWTDAVSGPSPQQAHSANSQAVTTSGSWSWEVSYDSDNPSQRDIAATCHEASALTIDNDTSD